VIDHRETRRQSRIIQPQYITSPLFRYCIAVLLGDGFFGGGGGQGDSDPGSPRNGGLRTMRFRITIPILKHIEQPKIIIFNTDWHDNIPIEISLRNSEEYHHQYDYNDLLYSGIVYAHVVRCNFETNPILFNVTGARMNQIFSTSSVVFYLQKGNPTDRSVNAQLKPPDGRGWDLACRWLLCDAVWSAKKGFFEILPVKRHKNRLANKQS